MKPAALLLFGLCLAAGCLPDNATSREARIAIEREPARKPIAATDTATVTATGTDTGTGTVTATGAATGTAAGTAAGTAKEIAADPTCPTGFTCDPDHGAREREKDREPLSDITEIFIQKQAHMLHLVAAEKRIVRSYSIAIGSGGLGQKRVEGDRVTPVGTYSVTGRYPSRWHTYLSLSFPNDEDRARFEALADRGEVNRRLGPGSAIAIHGHRADQQDKSHKQWDWTLGCVALDNSEIDEIAAVAPIGTRVVIAE